MKGEQNEYTCSPNNEGDGQQVRVMTDLGQV